MLYYSIILYYNIQPVEGGGVSGAYREAGERALRPHRYYTILHCTMLYLKL